MSEQISITQLLEIVQALTNRVAELEKESYHKRWNNQLAIKISKEKT